MTRLANQLVSYLLLLCISATVIPLNILHHHGEETNCDKSNTELENDPCHISSYHANDFQKPHCEHKTHFQKEYNHCEFCKFITSNRDKYTANSRYGFMPIRLSEANTAFEFSFFPSTVSSVHFSRGPPA